MWQAQDDHSPLRTLPSTRSCFVGRIDRLHHTAPSTPFPGRPPTRPRSDSALRAVSTRLGRSSGHVSGWEEDDRAEESQPERRRAETGWGWRGGGRAGWSRDLHSASRSAEVLDVLRSQPGPPGPGQLERGTGSASDASNVARFRAQISGVHVGPPRSLVGIVGTQASIGKSEESVSRLRGVSAAGWELEKELRRRLLHAESVAKETAARVEAMKDAVSQGSRRMRTAACPTHALSPRPSTSLL
eukprot:CAMPEP_0196753742 /NCGR_PEP_ID=MMETSP1091-20130531/91769_1 /TAXON_ID=302021 /ORGANISM="Rhodomonas sp., Strain CCMP768" /LENGTH=243 /DNA_ID=CAMNT_0042101897 /DNA_START=232 /DNA_END=963 /DNA_ORIENTATION=+